MDTSPSQPGSRPPLPSPYQLEEILSSGEQTWVLRATAMVDFSPSKNSLLRLQAGNGDYETATGPENVWEVYAQIVITLGSHTHKGEQVCSGH